MGNICTKASNRVSPEALPAPESYRFQLFRALGLGRFCATVDVQQDDGQNTQDSVVRQNVRQEQILDTEHVQQDGQQNTQDGVVYRDIQPEQSEDIEQSTAVVKFESPSPSMPDCMTAHIGLLYCNSSLICMLDNDDGDDDCDGIPKGHTEAESKSQKEIVSTDSHTAHAEEEKASSDEEVGVPSTESVTAEKDESKPDDDRNGKRNDGIKKYDTPNDIIREKDDIPKKGETQNLPTQTTDGDNDRYKTPPTHDNKADTAIDVKPTSSDSSSSSTDDGGILQQRPLSPNFFSISTKDVVDSSGAVDEEIEEAIEIENEEDDGGPPTEVLISIDTFRLKNAKKRATRYGRGEVSLPDGEIVAAKARLAFLRQGIDPDIDSNDINKDNHKHGEDNKTDRDHSYEGKNEAVTGCDTDKKILGENDSSAQMLELKGDNMHTIHYTENANSVQYSSNTYLGHNKDGASSENDPLTRETREHTDIVRLNDETTAHKKGCGVTNMEVLKVGHTPDIEKGRKTKEAYSRTGVETEAATGSSSTSRLEGRTHKEFVENRLSDSSLRSSISLATALSLDTIKSHSSRSDCIMSFYVRPPNPDLEPRKVEVRASAKQLKDGLAENHLKLLQNIHLPAKKHLPLSPRERKTKQHLFATPSLAVEDEVRGLKCVQKRGREGQFNLQSVPSFHEPAEKTKNARERLGLERLQKHSIGLQCKQIERIKIDAEEFPGILPPKVRAKWRKKMNEKKHIN